MVKGSCAIHCRNEFQPLGIVDIQLDDHVATDLRGRAGLPPTTVRGGTSFVTIAPAATIACSPTVTFGSRMAPAPIHASSHIVTCPFTAPTSASSRDLFGWDEMMIITRGAIATRSPM